MGNCGTTCRAAAVSINLILNSPVARQISPHRILYHGLRSSYLIKPANRDC
ncbi:hypothetical protein QO002_005894 [Pararhizobium capsulatum DSM 1112]|uniref:Uncharacterized protein n=1 Tax=Pararhizobium capsulatum DSM 1112 TaxID=1121113 RepID=A0ABU0C0F7_9HYPH|nr:hypothetical protein [Pararhizobium capsulatum DSM 1112]